MKKAIVRAFCVLAFTSTAHAQSATSGTWTATARAGEQVQLNLSMEHGQHWGRGIPLAELRGLTGAQVASPAVAPVTFRIEREAGVFELEGTFREGRGSGHFRFRPDRGFARALAAAGVEDAARISDRQMMLLAISGTSAATVRELMALGLRPRRVDDVVELAIHGVTPEYVRQMRALGIAGTESVRGVSQLRIHGVTAAYVRELEELGYGGLSRGQLQQMAIHRVTPAFVREVREAGFRGLSPEALVRMRIHRISPAELRAGRAPR